MPVNMYECLFLLDTSKVAGDTAGAVAQLTATLERHHAEILASRPWDERRLAYPINNQKKGLYYLIYFQTEGRNIAPIEHDFKLNEQILRLLFLKIEPKWANTMLALARDPNALALQAVVEEPLDGGPPRRDDTGEGPGGRGDRGDRRPRRPEAVGAEDKPT
jgi:small subunit ribosomal protein S6